MGWNAGRACGSYELCRNRHAIVAGRSDEFVMMEREEFRKHFTRLAEGQGELSGQAYLQDIYQNQPVDFDGLALDLERYRYKMEPFPDIDVLVKKGKKEAKITSQSYELLSSFKHEIFLPVENFLPVGNGWLLVQMPCVDGTLLGLARSEQRNLLFGGDGVQRGFSTSFRNMLIDLSSLIWKLEHKQLYPRKFSINDVYIKMVNGLPKVRVILTQVEQVRDYSDEKRNTLKGMVKTLVENCFTLSGVKMNSLASKFLDFMCQGPHLHVKHPMPVLLKSYPDNWTIQNKECYLICIFSSQLPWAFFRQRINESSGVMWPEANGSMVSVAKRMLDLDKKKSAEFPFDYLHVCRNAVKHFSSLPQDVKMELGSSAGLIQKMEEWDPEIWTKIYRVIGPFTFECKKP